MPKIRYTAAEVNMIKQAAVTQNADWSGVWTAEQVKEIIKATTPPSPIALDFKETEINGPEDMLMEIVRLKGILNAIYDAWTGREMDGVTENGIKEFLGWIKSIKLQERRDNNPYVLDEIYGKSVNQVVNEDMIRKMLQNTSGYKG